MLESIDGNIKRVQDIFSYRDSHSLVLQHDENGLFAFTGYIVRAGWHMSNSFQGIHVVIQSKHHPRELDEYIEEFVASMEAS